LSVAGQIPTPKTEFNSVLENIYRLGNVELWRSVR